ncbi:MAG: hypothetical protein LWX51_18225 [Deltaproteobacteria bacterium]|nr:hypothetical protein [Deltaproteobacteria bacterium]
MKKYSNFRWILSIVLLSMFILPVIVQADSGQSNLQFDLQGDAHYNRYNFTDIKKPYDGIDGWAELKTTYWIDNNKALSPYLSIIPSFTTESEFWWQRNFQIDVGFQWYPVETFVPKRKVHDKDQYEYLRNIRLFLLSAWREYYDEPKKADPEDTDFQIGMDYYYDNLDNRFDDKSFIAVVWTNAGFRKTNFSLKNYDAFLWTGNIKIGPRFKPAKTILLPYLVSDWTYVPKYDERWWENFLRVGAGTRWYPWFPKMKDDIGFFEDFLKRFNIYVEVLHNVAWFGDKPNNSVKETDFRIGLSFSTGGFFKK